MHRLIMLSSVYRASSVADETALKKDPENRLPQPDAAAAPGRRFAARHACWRVAGALNLKMGGVGVIPPLTKEEILAARIPEPVAGQSRPGGTQPPQRLSADEAVVDAAAAADLRCAGYGDELPAAGTVHGGAAGAGADEQRVHGARRRSGSRSGSRKQAGDNPRGCRSRPGWQAGVRASAQRRRSAQTALDYLRRNSLPRLCLLIFNMSEFVYVD